MGDALLDPSHKLNSRTTSLSPSRKGAGKLIVFSSVSIIQGNCFGGWFSRVFLRFFTVLKKKRRSIQHILMMLAVIDIILPFQTPRDGFCGHVHHQIFGRGNLPQFNGRFTIFIPPRNPRDNLLLPSRYDQIHITCMRIVCSGLQTSVQFL